MQHFWGGCNSNHNNDEDGDVDGVGDDDDGGSDNSGDVMMSFFFLASLCLIAGSCTVEFKEMSIHCPVLDLGPIINTYIALNCSQPHPAMTLLGDFGLVVPSSLFWVSSPI